MEESRRIGAMSAVEQLIIFRNRSLCFQCQHIAELGSFICKARSYD